jgi:hypothetical protein
VHCDQSGLAIVNSGLAVLLIEKRHTIDASSVSSIYLEEHDRYEG